MMTKPPGQFYDNLGEAYDLMIDWVPRLERETPFFYKVFRERGVKSVLDSACGSGRHAVEFARRGYDVAVCDISPRMLDLAHQNARTAGVKVEIFQSDLTEIDRVAGRRFDAVLCLGNSLPHLLTQRDLERAMRSVKRALAPGGIFIAQVRNYERILKENLRFMPPTSRELDGRELMFFRMLDIHGPRRVDFNIILFTRESGKWTYKVETTRLRPILKEHIGAALKRVGFSTEAYYSDYQFTPFESNKTLDLIVVAE
ncbi:MAG: class I SAM-dependent methyltransferase [Candidatus Abyssubacteria bacterium]